jgi:adenylate cyclase
MRILTRTSFQNRSTIRHLASRLEGLNKTYGTQTIVAEATYSLVKQAVAARPLDRVLVKGKTEPILIYELLGLKSEVDHATLELADVFSRALEHYWRQDWVRAATLFRSVLRAHAEDQAARLMLDRCIDDQRQPPGHDWAGVHLLTSKRVLSQSNQGETSHRPNG